MAAVAEPVGDVTAELGEGPYWVPDASFLMWVDIRRGLLHRTYFPSGQTVTDDLGEVSAAFPALDGGILTVGGRRLTLRELGGARDAGARGADASRADASRAGSPSADASSAGPATRIVAEIPARDGVRFNDAAVDPAGRVWAGSMHTGETDPAGKLYRLDAGGQLTMILDSVTVSNGIGWSPDGSRMYYVDSTTCRVDVFDYDPATGDASQRRVFADLARVEGVPDGLTVDADGYVWVAMWGGGVIRRFTPDGQQDAVLPVPVSQPTSCAFGGPGLADLYITTASVGLTESERSAQPLAGRLLRVRPGPIGLPSTTAEATIPS